MNRFIYQTASKSILGDMYTPASTYLKLRDLYPQSVLMESSDYHSRENSHSFIAINPIASIEIKHGIVQEKYPDGICKRTPLSESFNAIKALSEFIQRIEIKGDAKEYGGLYGFTSFNAIQYFEPVTIKDDTQVKNDAPDLIYILFKNIVVFDHFNNSLTLVELLSEQENCHLDELEKQIRNGQAHCYPFSRNGQLTSTLTDEEHKANIRQGIAHCLRGDVFQIVLSRRFIQKYEGDDFQLYRALRHINPSPYLFYFDFGGFRIFGSSPETHCRISQEVLLT